MADGKLKRRGLEPGGRQSAVFDVQMGEAQSYAKTGLKNRTREGMMRRRQAIKRQDGNKRRGVELLLGREQLFEGDDACEVSRLGPTDLVSKRATQTGPAP